MLLHFFRERAKLRRREERAADEEMKASERLMSTTLLTPSALMRGSGALQALFDDFESLQSEIAAPKDRKFHSSVCYMNFLQAVSPTEEFTLRHCRFIPSRFHYRYPDAEVQHYDGDRVRTADIEMEIESTENLASEPAKSFEVHRPHLMLTVSTFVYRCHRRREE